MGLSWVSDVRSLQKPLYLKIVPPLQTIPCIGRSYLISVTSFIEAKWICPIHNQDALTQCVEIGWLQANSNRAPTARLSILRNVISRPSAKRTTTKKDERAQDCIMAALFQQRHRVGNCSFTMIRRFSRTIAGRWRTWRFCRILVAFYFKLQLLLFTLNNATWICLKPENPHLLIRWELATL